MPPLVIFVYCVRPARAVRERWFAAEQKNVQNPIWMNRIPIYDCKRYFIIWFLEVFFVKSLVYILIERSNSISITERTSELNFYI